MQNQEQSGHFYPSGFPANGYVLQYTMAGIPIEEYFQQQPVRQNHLVQQNPAQQSLIPQYHFQLNPAQQYHFQQNPAQQYYPQHNPAQQYYIPQNPVQQFQFNLPHQPDFGSVNPPNYEQGTIIEQDEDAEGSIIKDEPSDDNFPDMGDVPAFVEPEPQTETSATDDTPEVAPADSDAQSIPDETVAPAQNSTRNKPPLPRDAFDKYIHHRDVQAGFVQALAPLCVQPKGTKAQKAALLRARDEWMIKWRPTNEVECMAYILVGRVWGYTYEMIKELGNINKAVATLRGKWRTMTKPPSERVRRPEWDEADDALIMRGYRRLTRSGTPRALWRRLGEWMVANGGRYPFGPAAIKKRWMKKNGRK